MSLHWDLKPLLDERYGAVLAGPCELKQDALVLGFENGLEMELRIASAHDYSFHWLWGEAELRIDTAPLHGELATAPNHLHDADGTVRPDPLTRPGAAAWDNVRAVLDAVRDDPLLERCR